MNLEQRFERVSENLIGVWKFRERKEKKKWAATYCFDSRYYDIYPVATIEKALDIVYGNLVKMRKKT